MTKSPFLSVGALAPLPEIALKGGAPGPSIGRVGGVGRAGGAVAAGAAAGAGGGVSAAYAETMTAARKPERAVKRNTEALFIEPPTRRTIVSCIRRPVPLPQEASQPFLFHRKVRFATSRPTCTPSRARSGLIEAR